MLVPVTLSAVIITLNEEHNIARCIRSLQGVADEILVVDSFSTDQTTAIATALGARVLQRPFEGYGNQKAFAEQAARHDWVLNIDADECLSDALRQSILAFKRQPSCAAYRVSILTNYCGAWIRHGGWYPNRRLRLWDRTLGRMSQDMVHEGWQPSDAGAAIGTLKGDLLHYSFPDISTHLRKIEHYSDTGARYDVARGRKASLLKIWLAPQWHFVVCYLLRGGFLDGYYGYVVCKNSAFAAYAKYTKIRYYRAQQKKEKTIAAERPSVPTRGT